MGGQDSYARDPLSYDIGSDSIFAGLRFKPAERLSLGLSGGYTQSDAAIRPFDLWAPDFVATHPATAFDFSQSHLYSDLDITRLDEGVTLRDAAWQVTGSLGVDVGVEGDPLARREIRKHVEEEGPGPRAEGSKLTGESDAVHP